MITGNLIDGITIETTDEFTEGRNLGRAEALEFLIAILRWMDGHGRGRATGLRNRAIVVSFLLNPDYRDFNQSDLLLRYGLVNRQLLNREIQYFRAAFPFVDSRLWSDSARRSLARSYHERNDTNGHAFRGSNSGIETARPGDPASR